MYIGGLHIEELACNCHAPYIETCMDENDNIKAIMMHVFDFEKLVTIESIKLQSVYDIDDLNMICSRCGKFPGK
jgi:hypothetical protein